MTIMEEAYEAHAIEQHERKTKYELQFKEDVNRKIEGWNELYDKNHSNQKLTHEELAFLIHEIGIAYDSSISNQIPYLQGHTQRLKEKHVDSNGIQTLVEVLSVYFESIALIFSKELGIFGRKKVIDSCIEQAKETLRQTEDKAEEAELFLDGKVDYMEDWEKNKRKWEIVDHQLLINRPFVPKEIQWMFEQAQWSIEEQVETGKLFFAHHFDRIGKKEYYRKRMENFSKVFTYYKKALETIATEPIPLLDTGQHLERMKNHLRDAKKECATEHHEVKEFLKKEKLDKNESDEIE